METDLPGRFRADAHKGDYRMALYEHTVMTRQDISAQQAEALNDTIKALIEEGGGSVAKIEYWGLRNLTYRIKKNRKAYYTLMDLDAPADALKEMERQMGLSEDVLRFMTIKVEKHEEGPSAMLQKRDRDDDRGDRPGGPRGDRGGFDRGPRPPRRF